MKFKYYTNKINSLLRSYKEIVDAQSIEYENDVMNIKHQASEMKGKWTDEYISEFVSKNNPISKHKEKFRKVRSEYEEQLNYCLDALKYQLDSFFNAPLSAEFADKINTIKSLNLQLSDREFDILKQDAQTYFERRALNELAKNRTTKNQQVTIQKNGDFVQEIADQIHPYNGVKVPNMDLIYNAYEEFKSNANRVISSYSGANAGLYEALDTNIPKHLSLTADSFFRNHATDKFASVMEAAEISKPIQKRVLTEADKAVIDTIIDPKFPYLAKSRVKQIAQNNFHLAELFSLDERYSKYVDEMEMKE